MCCFMCCALSCCVVIRERVSDRRLPYISEMSRNKKTYTAEEAAELLSDIINDPDSGDDCLATSSEEEDETSVEENEDFNEDYGN